MMSKESDLFSPGKVEQEICGNCSFRSLVVECDILILVA